MSLSIGIVGLPNVGKSTLFNALTSNQAVTANYPFATIDPNVGVVSVPDERLDALTGLYPGSPVVPSSIHFTDIAGLVEGANQGEGLGNQFLANIRETNAIAHVVRAFTGSNIARVDENSTPEKDIETINMELILADIQTLQKRRDSMAKQAKTDPKLQTETSLMDELLEELDKGVLVSKFLEDQDLDEYLETNKISKETYTLVRQLLTAKPVIFVFNIDEDTMKDESEKSELQKLVEPRSCVFICAQLEAELSRMQPEEATELLREYGQTESGMRQLIHTGYQTLGLESFFTAGEKEVRSWTIRSGSTAPQAAGTIHGDFERGFIAAEVINWKELVDAGSKSAARQKGLMRTEGKNYVMRDGDVAEFRFNT